MMMTKPRPQEEAAEETSTEKVSKSFVEPSSTEEHIENLEQRLTQLEPEKPPPEIVAKRRKQSALLARIQAAQEKARIQKEKMEQRKREEDAMLAALEDEIEAAKREEEAMLSEEEASTTAEDDDEEIIDEKEEAGDVAAATTTESPPPSAPPLEHLDEENPDYSILLPEKSEEKTTSYDIEALKDIRTPSPEPNIEYKMESTLTDEEHARLVEDQLRILESIKLSNENAAKVAQEVAASEQQNVTSKQAATAQPVPTERGASRTVQISGGQNVPLHGQEKTREAIAKGTAILVQCISCQNWMQVTETANLMFCPVCSVVSPVQKQSHIMTKEDALRETMDRRLAEQLQNEEWKTEEEESKEGWLSWMGLKREQTVATTQQSGEATKTWGEWLGIGAKKEEETKREEVRNRPGQMHDVLTGEEDGDEDREREGLLQARVAERKPLYSCVMESVTSVASSLGKVVAGDEEDEEGFVHGVNAEPLLTVTSAGREKDDNANEYSSLTLNEERR